MCLLFIKSLYSEEIIRAICWTLLHSLWQGLLLAIFVGITVLLTRKSGPSLRYNLISGLFFAFLIVSAVTFLRQVQAAGEASRIKGNTGFVFIEQPAHLPVSTADLSAGSDQSTNLINNLIEYFNLHASLVVTIWFIIFSARFVRVLGNLGYVQRVRHYKTHSPADYWKNRLLELAHGLGLKKHIALLESELIKVPLMVGFLKPLILVPFGLLAQLPADQVEAILLHELAHIKRKDYLVNLLQSFSETIFFFNPAVLWISALIREEREHCCDDIAIGKTKSKKEFIHALVAFQEYQESGPQYGIGFSRNNNHLLNRVKRIITNNNNSLNNMEKIVLASAFVLTGFVVLSFSQTGNTPARKANETVKLTKNQSDPGVRTAENDTVPGTIQIDSTLSKFIGIHNGKKYRFTEKNGKVVELFINDEKVPKKELAGYQPLVDRIMKTQKEEAERAELQDPMLNLEKDRMAKKQKEIMDLANELMIKQQELAREQNELSMKSSRDVIRESTETQKTQTETANNYLNKLNAEQEDLSALNSNMANQTYKELAEKQERQIEILKEELEKNGTSEEDIRKKLAEHSYQDQVRNQQLENLNKIFLAEKNPQIASATTPVFGLQDPNVFGLSAEAKEPTEPAFPSKSILLIINDLIDEKIVRSGKDISFTLNNQELVVNDVVQSPELHARFKAKYIDDEGDHFIYSNSTKSGKSTTHEEVHTRNSTSDRTNTNVK